MQPPDFEKYAKKWTSKKVPSAHGDDGKIVFLLRESCLLLCKDQMHTGHTSNALIC